MFWKVLATMVGVFAIVGVLYAMLLMNSNSVPRACTEEAKICADGSAVSRVLPNCDFAQCPIILPPATSTPTTQLEGSLSLAIGQQGTVGGVSVTPRAIISDSRCPNDPQVNCIWAGTVEIQLHIETAMGPSDMPIELGNTVTTEAHEIALTEVTPAKKVAQDIATSLYRFTFQIQPRAVHPH